MTHPRKDLTAIWIKSQKEAYFFDSYGEEPTEEIREYLETNFTDIYYNKGKFQNLFSYVCGPYTICFIYLMSLGIKFEKIMEIFSNYQFPDQFVKYFLRIFFQK